MFNVGDFIVYPMHGAGTIDAIEEKDILGEKQSYYILKMPGEVKVMVPTNKAEQIGVRSIIDKASAVIKKEEKLSFKSFFMYLLYVWWQDRAGWETLQEELEE